MKTLNEYTDYLNQLKLLHDDWVGGDRTKAPSYYCIYISKKIITNLSMILDKDVFSKMDVGPIPKGGVLFSIESAKDNNYYLNIEIDNEGRTKIDDFNIYL